MLEKEIERYLKDQAKSHGGIALKFVSPGFSGVPDRILLFKKGKLVFIELKAPGGKARPLQLRRKKQLEKLGFIVYVINSKEEVDKVINEMGGDAE